MNPSHDKPPVFLDRDGTIIVEKEYLSDPDQVFLEEGVIDGLTMLRGMGHPLIVVSNQSGIGRDKYTEADALRVNERVDELLGRAEIRILAWYICPHAPESKCTCRKPLPGMALAASSDWGVRLAGSYVIGDKRTDVELADAIGGTGILVTSGQGLRDLEWAIANARPAFPKLVDAAAYVCELEANIAARRTRDKESSVTELLKQ